MRPLCRIALLLLLAVGLAWPAQSHAAGSMYVVTCPQNYSSYMDSYYSESTNVFGFYADQGIPNTFSYDPFPITTGLVATQTGTAWASAPYDGTYYSGDPSLNPRVKIEDHCSNPLDRNFYYSGTGMLTSPDRRIDTDKTVTVTSGTRYPVAPGKKMSRRITAVGTSRITDFYLNGASIVNSEGWATYLEDSGNSSAISQDTTTNASMFDVNATAGSSVDTTKFFKNSSGGNSKTTPDNPYLNCRPYNPSSSNGYDTAWTTTVKTTAFYRCQTYLQMDPSTGASKTFYVYCSGSNTRLVSNKPYDVACRPSSTSNTSAWNIKSITNPTQSIAINNSKWLGMTMQCISSSSCYADSRHNRACDETWDPASGNASATNAQACSWSAGIFAGSGKVTVADSSSPTVAAPQIDSSQACQSGGKFWLSLACFRTRNDSSSSNWSINADVNASHQLGINRTYISFDSPRQSSKGVAVTNVSVSNKGSDGLYTYTYTTKTAHGLSSGDSVKVEGVYVASDGSVGGTFPELNYENNYNFQSSVSAVPSTTTLQMKSANPPGYAEIQSWSQPGTGRVTYNTGAYDTKIKANDTVSIIGMQQPQCDYGRGGLENCVAYSSSTQLTNGSYQVTIQCGLWCADLYTKVDAKAYLSPAPKYSTAYVTDPSDFSTGGGLQWYGGSYDGDSTPVSITANKNLLGSHFLSVTTPFAADVSAGDRVGISGSSIYDGDYTVAVPPNIAGLTGANSFWIPDPNGPSTVSITGIQASTPSSGKATFTTSSAHGFEAGQSITVSGITGTATGFNGTFTISSTPSTTQFVVSTNTTPSPSSSLLTNAVAKTQINPTLTKTLSDNYAIYMTKLPSISGIQPNTPSSGKATVTTTKAHGFDSGNSINLSGTGSYDGTYIIDSIPSGSTTQFVIPSSQTASASLSNATARLSPKNFTTCQSVVSNGVQSCYQPCARHIAENSKTVGYNNGALLPTFGSMLPCMGAVNSSTDTNAAANSTALEATHSIPVYKSGVLQSPWKTSGDNTIYAGAESPTETFAASATPATIGIDEDAPVSSGVSGAASCSQSSGGPTVTNASGANNAYWTPGKDSSSNPVSISAQVCDVKSGVEKAELHYQTCTPSSGETCSANSTAWSPNIPSFNSSGQYTQNRITSATMSNFVKGSSLGGWAAGVYNVSFNLNITTLGSHNLTVGDMVALQNIISGYEYPFDGTELLSNRLSPVSVTSKPSPTQFSVLVNTVMDGTAADSVLQQLPSLNTQLALFSSSTANLGLPNDLWGSQMDGTTTSRLSSNNGGCKLDLTGSPATSSQTIPKSGVSGASCTMRTDGLAEGTKARFVMVSRDAAQNTTISPLGSVITMDSSPAVYPESPAAPSSPSTSCSGSNIPLSTTTATGNDSKTGQASGYWGTKSYPYMFLRAAACDAGSGINKAEVHYEICTPSSSVDCSSSSGSWRATWAGGSLNSTLKDDNISSLAPSLMGQQDEDPAVSDNTDNRLSADNCFISNTTTQPGTVYTIRSASIGTQCKFKASGLPTGTKVRFRTVTLDGAGNYGVSSTPTDAQTLTIDNEDPVSLTVDTTSNTVSYGSSCSPSGYPSATSSSGKTQTGGVAKYWSPTIASQINLNAAACDNYSGIAAMEMHYQTCTPTTNDPCDSGSSNWTPTLKDSVGDSNQDQTGGTASQRLSGSGCVRSIATPAIGSAAVLPESKSLTNSACKFLAGDINGSKLKDGSKLRFVVVSQDGSGNAKQSSPSDALTIDSSDPVAVPANTSSCSTAANPGVAVQTLGGSSHTGQDARYWSPTVSADMVVSGSGCDSATGIYKIEMHYQTCTSSCSDSSNWSPTISSSSSDQTSSSPGGSTRLYAPSACQSTFGSPSAGSRVDLPSNSNSKCKLLTTGLADGTHVRLVLLTVDAAGNSNVSSSSTDTEYTIDNTPPSGSNLTVQKYTGSEWLDVTPESGVQQTWINSSKIRVSWSAAGDLSGVLSAQVEYVPGTCTKPEKATPASGQYLTISEDRSQECRQGQHQINLWAVDGAGNQTPEQGPSSFRFHYDSDPSVESLSASWPTLGALQPTRLQPQTSLTVANDGNCTPGASSSSTYNPNNSFTICWRNPAISSSAISNTIAPIAAVKFKVGGGAVQTVTNVSDCLLAGAVCKISTSDAAGLIAPSNGSHPITVWLEDQAGNSSSQESIAGVLRLFSNPNCP